MKHLTIFSALLGAGLLLPSCSDSVFDDGIREGETVITAVMETQEARTRTCVDMSDLGHGYIGLLWTPDDVIGVFGAKTSNAPFRTNSSVNIAKANFAGTMTGNDVPLRAYYPYSAQNDGADMHSLKGCVDATQEFDMTSGKISGDYKYGTPVSKGATEFNFAHIFSLLQVDIDASGTNLEDEKLEYIEIDVKGDGGVSRRINGDFTFDIYTGRYANLTNATAITRMVWTDKPLLSRSGSYTGFISVIPDVKAGDVITVTVATEGHKAVFSAPSKIDFRQGSVYNLPLKLSNFTADAKYGWMEKARPSIDELKFTVAANGGKLLDNRTVWSNKAPKFENVAEHVAEINGSEISLTIPYLYDFNLVPTFTAPEGVKLMVGDTELQSGVTAVDFSAPLTLKAVSEDEEREYMVNVTNTGLPVVVINQSSSGDFSDVKTGGFLGIGATVVNKFVDFKIRGKETAWVTDDVMTVYNADGSVDMPAATCGVRLRGNTSQAYPKKPLAIKMTSKQTVLGMPSHKRWVLLANWLDHSMIRNTVAFDVAHAIENAWKGGEIGEGIPWNVHGRNVELVIDGHHVGNYFLCEQIKIGSKRLNIQDNYEDSKTKTFETCGYLLELDNNYDETYKFITSKASVPFMFKDDVLTDEIVNQVKAKVQGIEDNLAAGNYSAAYENLDINSVIDQWLIWELTMNHEFLDPRSVYYFMDGDGKLCAGPVWDFDRATFQNPSNASSQGSSGDRVKPFDQWICWSANPKANLSASNLSNGSSCIWYPYLIKDPIFQAAVKQRWEVIYPYLQGVVSEIRQYGREMAKSFEYDSAMWPTDKVSVQAHKSGFSDWSGDENIDSFDALIENFVYVYESRLDGMNTLITSGRWSK